MRIYAISDIHGYIDELNTALSHIDLDDENTILVLLGDYIHGHDSYAVLDRVISMDCWCCTKKGTKVRKCPILQMIQSVLPYDPDPGFDNDACPIAGKTSLLAEEIT